MKVLDEEILRVYHNYNYLWLYAACLVLTLILLRGRRKQFVISSIIIAILILNPYFYRIWERLEEANVYWRSLWMIPIIPVCAAAIAVLEERISNYVLKYLAVALGIAAIIFCGSFIYSNEDTNFQSALNADKLPENVVLVGDALLEIDEEPRVVSDAKLSVYLRQYSGKIHSPYSRTVAYGTPSPLGQKMYDLLTEESFPELAQLMVNNDYDLLATENLSEDKQKSLDAAGFELLQQVNDFGIYRVHAVKTELRTYNDLGQVISVTTVDKQGQAINGAEGYSKKVFEYDPNGRISYEFHLDTEGHGVPDNSGKAGWQREYNYLGQIVKETFLDQDGKPVIAQYATRTCEYNFTHRLIKEEYYDEAGNRMLRKDTLYAVKTLNYDKEGRVASECYYGLTDEPVKNNLGFAEIEYIRDTKGNVYEERTYDEAHQLTDRTEGYSITRRSFNHLNKIISQTFYSDEDALTDCAGGYCRIENEYANDGSLLLSWFYNTKGDRVLCGSSFFHEYLQSLSGRNIVIFMSIKDEGTASLTNVLQEDLYTLGIQTKLLGKTRNSYYAVISPDGVQEEISNIETIQCSGTIGNMNYTVTSGGHNAGNISSIVIDGAEYSKNTRGINIVLFDLETNEVIESIAFDTYSPEMKVTR